jgi:hypothetical protein
MFGCRRQLLSVSRLFSAWHMLDAFRRIHVSDSISRSATADDGGRLRVTPVVVGRALQPTTANMLDPSQVEVLTAPDQLWPYEFERDSDALVRTEALLGDYRIPQSTTRLAWTGCDRS